MKIHKNIMPSLHIPIQSGSNNILKKMNRKIKVEEYLKLIKFIRKQVPNISITTDIIVGFPNETKKEFQKTINLYKKIKFDNAYTFIFSKRNGTVASSITDHTPLKEKENRLKKLNKIVKKYAKQNNKKYLNKVVEVLIDGYSKTNKSKLTGYSEQSKVVNFDGTGKTGETVKVKILTANSFSLEGKQIN
jgi:tRNA-2-methylthio-N6-dimethylallyladenosine synthase